VINAPDMIQQRAADDALIAQYELLRKLSNRVPGMIFQSRRYSDGCAILQYASDGIRELYEYEPLEVIGNSLVLMSRVDPRDKERVQSGVRTAVTQGHHWKCDYRVILPKRGERWLHVDAIPEPQSDGSALLHGHIIDITERKHAEENLRVLSDRLEIAVQSLEIGVWDLDLKTDTYVLSDRIYDIYGSPRGSFASVPDELMRRIHPDDRKMVVRKHYAAIAGASRFDAQFRIVRPDGQERVIRSTALVGVDDAGVAVRMTGVNWDITELKKAERMKSEFVSTVSHELRTPLTSIQGSLGLLCGTVASTLPANARKLLDVARRNSDRLALLINDLLDMEKIEAGRLQVELMRQPVMSLIEQSLEANAGYAVTYRVQFKLTQTVPDTQVLVDPNRFLQVMANLLSNAAKFSPAGTDVEVSATVAAGRVRIAVRDRGPGVAVEFRDSMFQKFRQADATDTRARSGTGLGLAISKAIVEGMEGAIGFDTAMGVGSVFYFELPVAPPETRAVTDTFATGPGREK
jgi:PAS domain S-box-containing protein